VKGVFFLSYGDATRASKSIQGANPEIQAADLTNALAQMIEDKEDNFVFYPTSDFFTLMQEKEEGGKQN
jgi:regulator of protease activity HflC (stomatin/prohibitin superfamily)